jgi:hypothetical protein
MIANKVRVYTTDREPQSRFAFWALCFFAFMALCLSLVVLTGCGQTDGGADADQPAEGSGFVIEDTSVVDVEIDGE